MAAGTFYQTFGFTPRALTVSQVTTGGTAVVIVAGPTNGGYVTNPPNAIAQGIATAENLYLDMVGTPGGTDTSGNGTTSILTPGGSFNIPSLAPGVQVQVNATTDGHKFTGEVW